MLPVLPLSYLPLDQAFRTTEFSPKVRPAGMDISPATNEPGPRRTPVPSRTRSPTIAPSILHFSSTRVSSNTIDSLIFDPDFTVTLSDNMLYALIFVLCEMTHPLLA